MNRNIKDIIVVCLSAFGIFLLPMAINYGFAEKKTDTFYKRVDADFDECVKNSNEDLKEIGLCKKIKRASELAFNSAKSVSESNSNNSIAQTVLFVFFAIMIFNVKSRIEDLEKK